MPTDPDDLLTYVGVALAAAIVFALVVIALAFASAPARAPDPPDVQWEVGAADGATVRITHAGGEPIAAENIVITVDGTRRNADWEGMVTEGDTAVVDAQPGQLVRIYWDANRGERALMVSERVE